MKFPKSIHAEGWADHIDTTPGTLSDTHKPAASHAGLPMRGAKLPASAIHLNEPEVSPSLSTTPPVTPRMASTDARPQQRAAALPPQRQNQLSWMIAAGAGAAVIAAVAVWSMNRPSEAPVPPAVISSAEPPTQVAAVTPEPPPAADRDDTTAAAPATTPEAVAPAPTRPAPSLTTVKPAAEARAVAQANVPAPRPDLVLRANPRSAALEPLPSQQPPTPVATAPVEPPLAIQPGTAPLTLPPTAAGSTSPGTPPLAQAPLPAPEDAGITVQVRSALASDSTLAAVPIAVSTDHGVVKLEGQAPDAPTRERATVVASSAAGVKAVDNRLTLPPTTVVSQAPSGL